MDLSTLLCESCLTFGGSCHFYRLYIGYKFLRRAGLIRRVVGWYENVLGSRVWSKYVQLVF